jgi:hypothetical protein
MKYETFRRHYILMKQDTARGNVKTKNIKRSMYYFDTCWMCVYICMCARACWPACEVPHVVGRTGNYKQPPFSSTLSFFYFTPSLLLLFNTYIWTQTSVYVNTVHTEAISKWNLLFTVITLFAIKYTRHNLYNLLSVDIICLAKHIPFRTVTKAMVALDVTPRAIT